MRAFVAYGTRSGCTTRIAERIGETLDQVGIQADVAAAKDAGSPAGYDLVIVGSGVRVGNWHASARTWVTEHADSLKEIPVAFFTCGLTILDAEKTAEVRGYTDQLIEETGVVPLGIGLFSGWNEPKEFSMLERGVLKMLKAPEGDFRDMEAIAAWTREIASKVTR